MADMQMKNMGWWFGRHLWWAGNRFERPGLYYWNGRENVRLIPWVKP